DAFGMPVCVLVLRINRRRERAYRRAVDRAQLFIQTAILFRSLGHLLEQTMCVNADTAVTDNHRQDQPDLLLFQQRALAVDERVRGWIVTEQKLRRFTREKLLLLRVSD